MILILQKKKEYVKIIEGVSPRRSMRVPEHFTPMKKWIIEVYIEVRNTPETAVRTHHKRDSSFVRSVVKEYRDWLSAGNGR